MAGHVLGPSKWLKPPVDQAGANFDPSLTFRQIKAVEGALTREFSNLPAGEVHREVVRVSEVLLAQAHFTDHVAVLTGRFVAERLDAAAALAAVAP